LSDSSRPVDDDGVLVADRLGNTLSHLAPEIMPPATQCGQMISYVSACRAFSFGISGSPDSVFSPKLLKTSHRMSSLVWFAKAAMWQ
jgi:hypothetical protein